MHILLISYSPTVLEIIENLISKGALSVRDVRISLIARRKNLHKVKYHHLYCRILGISQDLEMAEWLETAQAIHKLDPFNILFCFRDKFYRITSNIAKALNLKFFYENDLINLVNNKSNMRSKLLDTGIDSTNGRKVSGLNDIRRFAIQHGYPIILKPIDGSGSTGISIIRNYSDIIHSINWLKKWSTSRMYVESYLEGKEYSVEAFSEFGHHRIICITQKYKETTHFVGLGHCLPAVLNKEEEFAITDLIVKMLYAFNIQKGPTHTEIILCDGIPHIIETHIRIPGANIVELIKQSYGIDIGELWISQAFGLKIIDHIPPVLNPQSYTAVWFASPKQSGILSNIEGIENAEKVSGVKSIEILLDTNTIVNENPHNSYSRGASVVAIGSTYNEALESAQKAASMLTFVITSQ